MTDAREPIDVDAATRPTSESPADQMPVSAPPLAAGIDLRALDGFMLNVERLTLALVRGASLGRVNDHPSLPPLRR